MANIGLNPNFGEKNVQTFMKQYFLAMLCSFRLMVQDYWENLYHIVSEILNICHFHLVFKFKMIHFLYCRR